MGNSLIISEVILLVVVLKHTYTNLQINISFMSKTISIFMLYFKSNVKINLTCFTIKF